MDIFDLLTFIGGISMFLFGMNVMGKALERRAGSSLRKIISKLTTNKFLGLLTGIGVTAVIQSSSATTVMVVGLVNSGIMSLSQSVGVIIGANIGTTITSWILSLGGISGSAWYVKIFKPSSFSPILALIGIILYMFCKDDKKKETGQILLGFAVLMFGMETMSSSVAGLKSEEWFTSLFTMFENPFLGVLAGALLTAVIQSSSASVGILQALALTGSVSFGSAIPIILGQNIGTCVTALISSIGTNRNAKRASLVHLFFNLIGTIIALIVFCIVKYAIGPAILSESATMVGIAVIHSMFNILCTVILFPCSSLLEKLVCLLVPDKSNGEISDFLDERLFKTPAIALEQARSKVSEMAEIDHTMMDETFSNFKVMDKSVFTMISTNEERTDEYEDKVTEYLVKLSAMKLDENDSYEIAEYLKIVGDLERIGDHLLNITQSQDEMIENNIKFSDEAVSELKVYTAAVRKVFELTCDALKDNDTSKAFLIEPLEEVVDELTKELRDRHIHRIQQEKCDINKGFIWSDLLTNMERLSDHCSNIAFSIIDKNNSNMNTHQKMNEYRNTSENFNQKYAEYKKEYALN